MFFFYKILLVIYFAVIALSLILSHDETMPLSDMQVRNLVIYVLLTMLRYYGYIVFSAMIMLLTDSTAAGIVACVFFAFIFMIAALYIAVAVVITMQFYRRKEFEF